MTVAAHLKFCSERSRLLDLLRTAAADYAAAVNNLSREMESLDKPEYVRNRRDVEHSRMDAQHAREALLAHKASHGC